MNELINGNAIKMTSIEIAELVGKRHDNVKRTIIKNGIKHDIKYEYYLDGIHSSYPDFLLVDKNNKIHLFEVKSVNFSSLEKTNFDSEAYKRKVDELKKCYLIASHLTGQIFYLPVLRDDVWHITKLEDGTECNLTKEQFINAFA